MLEPGSSVQLGAIFIWPPTHIHVRCHPEGTAILECTAAQSLPYNTTLVLEGVSIQTASATIPCLWQSAPQSAIQFERCQFDATILSGQTTLVCGFPRLVSLQNCSSTSTTALPPTPTRATPADRLPLVDLFGTEWLAAEEIRNSAFPLLLKTVVPPQGNWRILVRLADEALALTPYRSSEASTVLYVEHEGVLAPHQIRMLRPAQHGLRRLVVKVAPGTPSITGRSMDGEIQEILRSYTWEHLSHTHPSHARWEALALAESILWPTGPDRALTLYHCPSLDSAESTCSEDTRRPQSTIPEHACWVGPLSPVEAATAQAGAHLTRSTWPYFSSLRRALSDCPHSTLVLQRGAVFYEPQGLVVGSSTSRSLVASVCPDTYLLAPQVSGSNHILVGSGDCLLRGIDFVGGPHATPSEPIFRTDSMGAGVVRVWACSFQGDHAVAFRHGGDPAHAFEIWRSGFASRMLDVAGAMNKPLYVGHSSCYAPTASGLYVQMCLDGCLLEANAWLTDDRRTSLSSPSHAPTCAALHDSYPQERQSSVDSCFHWNTNAFVSCNSTRLPAHAIALATPQMDEQGRCVISSVPGGRLPNGWRTCSAIVFQCTAGPCRFAMPEALSRNINWSVDPTLEPVWIQCGQTVVGAGVRVWISGAHFFSNQRPGHLLASPCFSSQGSSLASHVSLLSNHWLGVSVATDLGMAPNASFSFSSNTVLHSSATLRLHWPGRGPFSSLTVHSNRLGGNTTCQTILDARLPRSWSVTGNQVDCKADGDSQAINLFSVASAPPLHGASAIQSSAYTWTDNTVRIFDSADAAQPFITVLHASGLSAISASKWSSSNTTIYHNGSIAIGLHLEGLQESMLYREARSPLTGLTEDLPWQRSRLAGLEWPLADGLVRTELAPWNCSTADVVLSNAKRPLLDKLELSLMGTTSSEKCSFRCNAADPVCLCHSSLVPSRCLVGATLQEDDRLAGRWTFSSLSSALQNCQDGQGRIEVSLAYVPSNEVIVVPPRPVPAEAWHIYATTNTSMGASAQFVLADGASLRLRNFHWPHLTQPAFKTVSYHSSHPRPSLELEQCYFGADVSSASPSLVQGEALQRFSMASCILDGVKVQLEAVEQLDVRGTLWSSYGSSAALSAYTLQTVILEDCQVAYKPSVMSTTLPQSIFHLSFRRGEQSSLRLRRNQVSSNTSDLASLRTTSSPLDASHAAFWIEGLDVCQRDQLYLTSNYFSQVGYGITFTYAHCSTGIASDDLRAHVALMIKHYGLAQDPSSSALLAAVAYGIQPGLPMAQATLGEIIVDTWNGLGLNTRPSFFLAVALSGLLLLCTLFAIWFGCSIFTRTPFKAPYYVFSNYWGRFVEKPSFVI